MHFTKNPDTLHHRTLSNKEKRQLASRRFLKILGGLQDHTKGRLALDLIKTADLSTLALCRSGGGGTGSPCLG